MKTVTRKTTRSWFTCTELEKQGWDFQKECLAMLVSDKGRTIVRTNGADFAVMMCGGPLQGHLPTLRIVKVLPTMDAARAYQFAMHN